MDNHMEMVLFSMEKITELVTELRFFYRNVHIGMGQTVIQGPNDVSGPPPVMGNGHERWVASKMHPGEE